MIILKEVKHDIPTNSVEATWVNRTQPADIEVPEVDAVLDEEGNIVSPAVAAHSITPEPIEVQVKCHSYADVQMSMFRADIVELGGDIDEYEALITLVEAGIKPPTPITPAVAVCDPWQIRKALTAMGLRQAVEDAVAASSDQTLKDGWEFAPRFRSDDPFVLAMGAALGKSEAEIRDLIALAATL